MPEDRTNAQQSGKPEPKTEPDTLDDLPPEDADDADVKGGMNKSELVQMLSDSIIKR